MESYFFGWKYTLAPSASYPPVAPLPVPFDGTFRLHQVDIDLFSAWLDDCLTTARSRLVATSTPRRNMQSEFEVNLAVLRYRRFGRIFIHDSRTDALKGGIVPIDKKAAAWAAANQNLDSDACAPENIAYGQIKDTVETGKFNDKGPDGYVTGILRYLAAIWLTPSGRWLLRQIQSILTKKELSLVVSDVRWYQDKLVNDQAFTLQKLTAKLTQSAGLSANALAWGRPTWQSSDITSECGAIFGLSDSGFFEKKIAQSGNIYDYTPNLKEARKNCKAPWSIMRSRRSRPSPATSGR